MTKKAEKNTCTVCGCEFGAKDAVNVSCEGQKYLACPKCGSTKRSRVF